MNRPIRAVYTEKMLERGGATARVSSLPTGASDTPHGRLRDFLWEFLRLPVGGSETSCRIFRDFLGEVLVLPAGSSKTSCRWFLYFLQEVPRLPTGGSSTSCGRFRHFLREVLVLPVGGSKASCRRCQLLTLLLNILSFLSTGGSLDDRSSSQPQSTFLSYK